MDCQDCGQQEASVVFTQVVEKEKFVFHLCRACACKRSGEIESETVAVSTFTFPAVSEETASLVCETCGTTFGEFRKSGRFGCIDCYDAFDSQLHSVFKLIHGLDVHKTDATTGEGVLQERKLSALQDQLEHAVTEEAFEEAAKLRDQIARLKGHAGVL